MPASSGIGRSIALEFGREGANVIVVDIQKSPKQGKYHEQDVVTSTKEEIEKSKSLIKKSFSNNSNRGRRFPTGYFVSVCAKRILHFSGA